MFIERQCDDYLSKLRPTTSNSINVFILQGQGEVTQSPTPNQETVCNLW